LTRRSRVEQKFAVLDACMVPLNCTHLMYQTQVNYTMLNLFVAELLEKGLLTEKMVGKRPVYRTSTAGFELLKQWRQLGVVVGA
jgi:predicted transcriptional regulator